MATILMRRRWRWIGHVTHQETPITKTALHWTPKGLKAKERPPEDHAWRRTVEKEMKQMGKTWNSIQVMAKNRQVWRDFTLLPYTPRGVMGISE